MENTEKFSHNYNLSDEDVQKVYDTSPETDTPPAAPSRRKRRTPERVDIRRVDPRIWEVVQKLLNDGTYPEIQDDGSVVVRNRTQD